MKKYIAPELEVELYSLNDSIAAGCKDVRSLYKNGYITEDQLESLFGDSNGYDIGDGSKNLYNLNVLAGGVDENGGCDCEAGATGNMTS